MEYWPEDHGEDFIIVTNDCDDEKGVHTDCALNNKLMRTPIQKPDRSHCRGNSTETMYNFKGWTSTKNTDPIRTGKRLDHSGRIDSNKLGLYHSPSRALISDLRSSNPSYDTRKFRYGYASLPHPLHLSPTSTQTHKNY